MTRGRRSTAVPLVVRLAGLPSRFLAGLGSEEIEPLLAAAEHADDELAAIRQALVARLHEAIAGAPAERRRLLLAVKRDAYNGRGLEPWRAAADWPLIERESSGLAGEALRAQRRRAERRQAFADCVEHTRAAEHRVLAEALAYPGFARGLTLAAPALAAALDRFDPAAGRDDRRRRKLVASLLRYVSRAAIKVSPFSTLGRVAVGEIADDACDDALVFAGERWTERSLLRLRPFVVEQVVEMLLRHERFRTRWPVGLNSSIHEPEEGGLLVLRPSGWRLDPGAPALAAEDDRVALLELPEGLLARLRRLLADGPRPHGELTAAWAREVREGDAASARASVDRLLDAGLLVFHPPWTPDRKPCEEVLLDHLAAVRAAGDAPAGGAGDEALEAVHDELSRLVALERSWDGADEPRRAVEALHVAIDGLWAATARAAGLPRPVSRGRTLYEDVLLRPAGEARETAALRLSREVAERLNRTLDPWVRLANLYRPGQDFLIALGAWLERQWPHRRHVALLEVLHAARPLWRELQAFSTEQRQQGRWRATFDPFALPAAAELAAAREEAWQGLPSCLVDGGEGEVRLCRRRLALLVADLPQPLTAHPYAAAFVQPLDAHGERWVLNRLSEGTGRLGSRFTPAMDPATRRWYADSFGRRGRIGEGPDAGELLDVTRPAGDTLNLHAVQTPHVLELPGQRVAGRPRVPVDEIAVAWGHGRLPELVDGRGQRLLPVHLGGTGHSYVPGLSRFLAQFGPGELKATFPPLAPRRRGDVLEHPRLLLDDLVIRRRSWSCERDTLRALLDVGSTAAGIAALAAWRRAHAVPRRVFLLESVETTGRRTRRKPQFLDLESPLCVSLLTASLRRQEARVEIEEALPDLGDLPAGPDGEPRACEVLIDGLVLAPPAPRAARPPAPGASRFAAASHIEEAIQPEPLRAHN